MSALAVERGLSFKGAVRCKGNKRIAAAGERAACCRSSSLVFWSRRRWQSAPVADEIIISQSTSRPRHLWVGRELDAAEIAASKAGSKRENATEWERKFACTRGGEKSKRRRIRKPPAGGETAKSRPRRRQTAGWLRRTHFCIVCVQFYTQSVRRSLNLFSVPRGEPQTMRLRKRRQVVQRAPHTDTNICIAVCHCRAART